VGKSVSLKHIMGFLKADSGQIFDRWRGRYALYRAANLRRFAVRSRWCFNPARCSIAERRGKYCVSTGGPAGADRRRRGRLRRKNLRTCWKWRKSSTSCPANFPTGMKRAVAIARALAQNPEAILYDEPTTMVDPSWPAHGRPESCRLKEAFHKTSIVVTHDTHLASGLRTILFSFKTAGRRCSARGRNSKVPRIVFCGISCCRMN